MSVNTDFKYFYLNKTNGSEEIKMLNRLKFEHIM